MAGCATNGLTANQSSLTPVISVAVMQAPPASLPTGGIITVSATVNNDTANAGVDWTAVCGSAPKCGTFNPTHTSSGMATIYTGPPGVPTGNTVTVKALSTTDHSKTASAKVIITTTVSGITFTTLPPATVPSGGSVSMAAAVQNDPSNGGVDWTADCGGINCTSSFLGAHTVPGVATIFVVPTATVQFPMIVGSTVTITAFATADHVFSATATFIVTAPISISITQPPPSTVLTGANVPVTAVVSSDPANAGVTWTIESCDVSPCGSWAGTSGLLSTHAASGQGANYVAPPQATGHVILQAAATSSPLNAFQTVVITVVPPISIAITTHVTNGTIIQNHTASLVATVTSDPSNAGVNWTVTCGTPGACGSFSPTNTASLATVTYTAPSAVPAGNTVTITAASAADPTKTDSETVTITASAPPDSLLSGQYVLLLTGKDQNNGPYELGGVIVSDGAGNITKGSLDVADVPNAGNISVQPSTYSLQQDGRGQILLKVNTVSLTGNFGVGNNSITLSVAFVTNKHALISESDSFGSGTGTLDLQDPTSLTAFQNSTAGLNGAFAINLTGSESIANNPPYFLAGVVSFQFSAGTTSEKGYGADQVDQGKVTTIPITSVTAPAITFSASPDIYGKMILGGVNLGLPTLFNLDVWLIDAQHFVVTDWRDTLSTAPALSLIVSGHMISQPTTLAVSGTYAFTETGAAASPTFTPQAVGGIITCGASTGMLDVVPFARTVSSVTGVTATCATGRRGLITLTNAGTTGVSKFAAYPTVDQGLLFVELDGGAAGTSGPSGAGAFLQQTLAAPISATALVGNYAANFLANTPLGLEAFAGQIVAAATSNFTGELADVNSFTVGSPTPGNPSVNAVLSGSFTAGTNTNGRLQFSLTIAPASLQPTPEFTILNPVCYILDANTCLLLGTDATAPGTGILELQNTGL